MNRKITARLKELESDPEDRLLIDAVRQGVKNLISTEKTILLRTVANFTTQETHREFYYTNA